MFQFNLLTHKQIRKKKFVKIYPFRRGESVPTLERATKFNPMFESESVTAQYYRRYDDEMPQHYSGCDRSTPQCSSSISTDGSKDLSSDEMQHIYQNTTLTKEVQK